ncbi:MAG: hypothetical protein U0974_04530 [Gemmatimonadales bacterium]|jgi:anti-sigma28 factor (negative regulator of flagellin synthesis)|nr:hypothetical protein [Gemmatimonadales bacterium]MDZ4388975.1 hypothetical protein [Gemmatimonadales bacterium]
MAIDPLGSGAPADPTLRRATDRLERGQSVANQRAPIAAPADAPAGDSVVLSAEAIRRASGADIPSGTLSAERLAEITQRIADGSYDSEAAREAIAKKVVNGER